MKKVGNLTPPPLLNAKLIRFGPLFHENPVFFIIFLFLFKKNVKKQSHLKNLTHHLEKSNTHQLEKSNTGIHNESLRKAGSIPVCFHVYAQNSLSHSLTLSYSHSHTLSTSHSLTLDMVNNFCFHLYAQK